MRQRHSFTMQRFGVALLRRIVPVLLLILSAPVLAVAPTPTAAATFFGSPKFQQQYEMGEAIVANFWGPLATAQEPQVEAYAEGQAGAVCKPMQACPKFIAVGRRLVQYFDKARMEQNMPGGPVTNGLLAVELITGRVQVGDTQYDQRQPAAIVAVGDPTNTFPTYADFAKWQMATASGNGPVTTLAQPGGSVDTYMAAMNDPLTKIGATDMGGMHGVPLAFSQFRDTVGLPTVGLAITEPFWVQVKVAGASRVVLTQAFERRVLTYTPDNPDPYKVEFGNIGAHYFQWRYPNGVSSAAMGSGTGGAATPPTIPTTPGGGSTMMGPAPRSLPLPAAPSGFALRSVHEFTATDGPPIRALFHPKTGVLHVMTNTGNLFQIDRASGMATHILSLASTDPTPQVFYAADFGPDGTFYAVRCLQPPAIPGEGTTHTAEILRVTDDTGDGTVKTITVLNRLQYPGGNLRFNHEVTSLKYGPDGMLYIGAGSHTDHGELDGGVGEVTETSAVFRISPTMINAPFELFADGIRNPFAAAFRADGKLFIADHGPQNDLPEELNYVQQGKDYGFPYRFGNNVKNPEPDAPAEPPGLTFTTPIANTGPDSLNSDGLDSQNPSYTFLPHSAPGGLTFYSATVGTNLFPMSYRGDGFLAMYGNIERNGETRGFAVLRLTLTEGMSGDFTVSVHIFLAGLRRPTDVAIAPDGALIVLESSGAAYPTDQTVGYGRILEIVPA